MSLKTALKGKPLKEMLTRKTLDQVYISNSFLYIIISKITEKIIALGQHSDVRVEKHLAEGRLHGEVP